MDQTETKQAATPGPWACWQREEESGTNYWRIRTSNDQTLSDTLHGYCGGANARLIAAAPDLLEACKAALSKLEAIYEARLDTHIVVGFEIDSLESAIALASEGK